VTELENEPVLSGYGFQIDLVRRSWQLNANIVEIPIQFIERRAGRSKMGLPIVREAMARLAMWWISRWFKRIAQRR
jgi:dolichol-phosphate mannosyltransferase